jgi:hypothetical protein
MTAITLQQKLIKKIAEIDDVTILKSIDALLKAEAKPRKLNELQKKLILKSLEQYNQGEIIENDALMDKLAKKYGW